MTRTKRGSIARKRRIKSTSNFRGARSNRTRTILQQRIKALVSFKRYSNYFATENKSFGFVSA